MRLVFTATSWNKFVKSLNCFFPLFRLKKLSVIFLILSLWTPNFGHSIHTQIKSISPVGKNPTLDSNSKNKKTVVHSKLSHGSNTDLSASYADCQFNLLNAVIISESLLRIPCLKDQSELKNGQLIGLIAENEDIVGLFQYMSTEHPIQGMTTDDLESTQTTDGLTLKLLSLRSKRLSQATDRFTILDLHQIDSELKGTTFLSTGSVIEKSYHSQYKPLFTQGTTIGETAQTLYHNEWFFNVYGTLAYGFHQKITGSTNLLGLALGSPNAQIKTRVFKNENQTWAISVNMAQERDSSERLFNVDLVWDSILSDKLISHSLISAAVISFDSAKDIAAVKSYGSSSFQTGYEYIFDDWSRFLIGPSYNIDKRALGGYLGYLKIYDHFHFQVSLTSNNIRRFQFSAEEGYLIVIDAYWRW